MYNTFYLYGVWKLFLQDFAFIRTARDDRSMYTDASLKNKKFLANNKISDNVMFRTIG